MNGDADTSLTPLPSELHPARAEARVPVALTREDMAAIIAAYRNEVQGRRQWAWTASGIGGLFLAVVLMMLGEHFHWPDTLDPIFLGGGWAMMLLSWFGVARRERRLWQHYQVECPACGEGLLVKRSLPRSITRAELAIATGNCPSCGAHFLDA